MSSEIRSGDSRTYWIVSNGVGFFDGVTDPNLVTTVGNGCYLVWVGTDYNEYVAACATNNIIPRNSNPDVPSTGNIIYDRLSARQVRLWLLNNGITLDMINSAINNIEDSNLRDSVAIEWEYAPYIERNHPMLIPLAQTLGLTENDINRAFMEAATI